jgi:hypothetical protein
MKQFELRRAGISVNLMKRLRGLEPEMIVSALNYRLFFI